MALARHGGIAPVEEGEGERREEQGQYPDQEPFPHALLKAAGFPPARE